MTISRRDVFIGQCRCAGRPPPAFSFPAPAIRAVPETIKIGWPRRHDRAGLGADTRLQSRRQIFAVDAINGAGGVKGRKLEVIIRRHNPGRSDQGP